MIPHKNHNYLCKKQLNTTLDKSYEQSLQKMYMYAKDTHSECSNAYMPLANMYHSYVNALQVMSII